MKIRSGFVSNSSSSSFVIVGCEINKEELKELQNKLVGRKQVDDSDDKWNDDAHDALDMNGWLYVSGQKGNSIVGKTLGCGIETLENKSFSFDQLSDLKKEIKKYLNKEARLYVGNSYC